MQTSQQFDSETQEIITASERLIGFFQRAGGNNEKVPVKQVMRDLRRRAARAKKRNHQTS